MIDREALLIKVINYDHPEEIPIGVGTLPSVWLKYPDEMSEFAKRFPDFFEYVDSDYDYNEYGQFYQSGSYADHWGCVWTIMEEGVGGIVTEHPVKNREDILKLEIPKTLDGDVPHGFMFLRITDLRGFEEAMADFGEECDELQILIDKILEYNCIQTKIISKNAGRFIYFGDDLGMQHGLPIGPAKWRKYLKPCYTKIFKIARDAGKYVYMHSDGMIYEIIPDLFEAGAHMVNPQFRANGIDNLVDVCKGRFPINLDLDRQMFPFAAPQQCRNHVFDAVGAMYMPEGGLGLNIELGPDIPLENIEAILQAAHECRFYKG